MGKRKFKTPPIDGLDPRDVKRIRSALRDVWRYTYPHRLVVKRCLIAGGFSRCEKCRKKCPKVFVDHIERVGDNPLQFVRRMFIPSSRLAGLCKTCHDQKTAGEKLAARGGF